MFFESSPQCRVSKLASDQSALQGKVILPAGYMLCPLYRSGNWNAPSRQLIKCIISVFCNKNFICFLSTQFLPQLELCARQPRFSYISWTTCTLKYPPHKPGHGYQTLGSVHGLNHQCGGWKVWETVATLEAHLFLTGITRFDSRCSG